MKWTNKSNLPQAFVDAVTNDEYNKGDAEISVTGLLKPPRAIMIEREHWNEMEEDVEDRLWAFFGQLAHKLLERADTGRLTEKRLFAEISDVKVSGQIDSMDLEKGILTDYKTVSLYRYQKGGIKVEWEKQLNMYAHLLRLNNHEVKGLQVFAIIRDHRDYELRDYLENPFYKSDAKNGSYKKGDPKSIYPPSALRMNPIPLWTDIEAVDFITDRIAQYQAAKEKLPQCTKDDTWQGRRCAKYCSAAPWCEQYKNSLIKTNKE